MSAIFISHSSRDTAFAERLRVRLSERGFESVFLDFDPDDGIPAGRSWERELYHRLKLCRAVIALCSEQSARSRWCFAEITQARALGKPFFPLLIDGCRLDDAFRDTQAIDLVAEPERGYERLWRGLERAGLAPGADPDPNRAPYPGLNAFEEADAPYFFGREESIGETVELLTRMRQYGEPRMAVVLGASGSGKSSLVRAGVLPSLKRDPERWLAVPSFRPRERPFDAAAQAFAEGLAGHGEKTDWKRLQQRLASSPEAWNEIAGDLLVAAGQRESTALLFIDQFEELLGQPGSEEPSRFLRLLREALTCDGSRLLLLTTLRSDYLAVLQGEPTLQGLPLATVNLGPMQPESLPGVIEGPAALAGLEFEPGLVTRMVTDSRGTGALPLLAFTLRELYERRRQDGRLTLEAYEQELGGIDGAVARVAEEVMASRLTTEPTRSALRSALLRMVRINEEGQFVRRRVAWDELPEPAHPLLEKFTSRRLLISWGGEETREVEVAHEALFRAWGLLADWLDQERGFLLWQRRLRADREDWQLHGRDSGSLLQGAALAEAQRWREERSEQLERDDRLFVDLSLSAERGRLRRRGLVRALAVGGGTVALALIGLALYLQAQASQASKVGIARDLSIKAELIRDREADALQRRALLATEAVKRFDALGTTSVEAGLALRRALSLLPVPLARYELPRAAEAVAFSADGRSLTVVLTRPRAVVVLDRETGSEVVGWQLPGDHDRANAVSLSSDGRFIASALEGTNVNPRGSARVWDVRGEREVGRFSFNGQIRELTLSGQGKYLALKGSDDPDLVLLDVARAQTIRTIKDYRPKLAFSADDRYMIVPGSENKVLALEGDGGEDESTRPLLELGPTDVRGGAFSANGARVTILNRTVRALDVWSVAGGRPRRMARLPIDNSMPGALPLSMSARGEYVAFPAAAGAEHVTVISIATEDRALIPLDSRPRAIVFDPEGTELAIAESNAKEVRVWSMTGGSEIAGLSVGRSIAALRFADAGRLVTVRQFREASGGRSTGEFIQMRVYDAAGWNEIEALQRTFETGTWALTPDGRFMTLYTSDNKVQIHGVLSGDTVFSAAQATPVELLGLGHDRRLLAVAGPFPAGQRQTGRAVLWSLPEGDRRTVSYKGGAAELQLGPAGRYLTVGRFEIVDKGTRGERVNRSTHVYDLDTGEETQVSKALRDVNARAIEALGAGSEFRAGITAGGVAAVWDSAGEELIRIEEVEDPLHAAVSPDGRLLVTADSEGLVRIFPLDPADLVALACSRLARNLTVTEWEEHLPDSEEFDQVCPD